MLHAVVASIPSPASGNLELGPISIHVYGLMLALGVVVAVKVTMVRWGQRGGDPNEILDGALFVVLCGVIGARVYHVITDYQRFDHGHWLDAFKIWKGGLSIWGAVLGGAVGVIIATRRKHASALVIADCVVPGLFFAQAIGRWGNWFNQELFGKPSTLPWALEIAPAHRPPGYETFATFHPTFLYESFYCLLGGIALLWIDKRFTLKRGQLTALYVVLYTFARFFFENLRIDDAHKIGPLRVNAWVSAGFFVLGAIWFFWLGRRPEPTEETGDPATAASA
ncbi:MAG: prolipoprotein diacylglyceryl transferase [Acidimicrobiia bacterium]